MARPYTVEKPDLPQLTAQELPAAADGDVLEIAGALVEHDARPPVSARLRRIDESELRGVAVAPGEAPGLVLRDLVLRDCDFSNVHARQGSIRRVVIHGCRFVGFAFEAGDVRDLHVVDGTLMLGSFAGSHLERVVFEGVVLRDASFSGARLEAVTFAGCDLAGADFRGAKLENCVLRGSSLDGVVGVQSLAGLEMPWADVIASSGALAAALGIAVQSNP